MFPRWDLTWLLGGPFCLCFTFLWRLRAWSQLEMGRIDCLKVSSYTEPRLRIIYTWLNSLPCEGSGSNFLPSFAEWKTVPFLASSVCFHLGNSLILPGLNTSLLFPHSMPLIQRLEEIPTLKLWHFLVYIGMDCMDLLCIARSPAWARRGPWWFRWSLQGQSSFLWVLLGDLHVLFTLSTEWWQRMGSNALPQQVPGTFPSW